MNLRILSTEALKAAHLEALCSLAMVGSANLSRTRLCFLGAVSAELANRK